MAQEIHYHLQELDAGRATLPVASPRYRLAMDWASEVEPPPGIEERFADLAPLLKDPVWPLPWDA